MKIVSLLLLAGLATLAWANPSYYPDEDADYNPGDDYMYYPSDNEDAYEEHATEQSTDVTTQGYNERAEIMAQSICTAISGPRGWVFAVRRECKTKDTCENICASKKLHSQAPQKRIRVREWRATAALHIYRKGPSKGPSTVDKPYLGFWVYRYANVNTGGYCGPNYCCCFVAFNDPV